MFAEVGVQTAPASQSALVLQAGAQCPVGRFDSNTHIALPASPQSVSLVQGAHWPPLPTEPDVEGVLAPCPLFGGPDPAGGAAVVGLHAISARSKMAARPMSRTFERMGVPSWWLRPLSTLDAEV